MTSRDISALLLDCGAVKVSVNPPFTWTSGMKAPIYCDNRAVLGHPKERTQVVEALTEAVRALPQKPDAIAGTATAGIAWAALVADRLKLPMAYVRHKAKEYGAGKNIEGAYREGDRMVVIEDLISTGGSAVRTVEILRSEGKCTVTDIVAIFTYGFPKAAEAAAQAKVSLTALSDFATLLAIAREQGTLTEEEVCIAAAFSKDPEGWLKQA